MKLTPSSRTSKPKKEEPKPKHYEMTAEELEIKSSENATGTSKHLNLRGSEIQIFFNRKMDDMPFDDVEFGRVQNVYRLYSATVIQIKSTTEDKVKQILLEDVKKIRIYGKLNEFGKQPRIR